MNSRLVSMTLAALLSLSGLAQADSHRCYWMENMTGEYLWIPAAEVYGEELTKEQCYELDSCDGGLGYSGGGCYKWASSPDAEREPWFTE